MYTSFYLLIIDLFSINMSKSNTNYFYALSVNYGDLLLQNEYQFILIHKNIYKTFIYFRDFIVSCTLYIVHRL